MATKITDNDIRALKLRFGILDLFFSFFIGCQSVKILLAHVIVVVPALLIFRKAVLIPFQFALILFFLLGITDVVLDPLDGFFFRPVEIILRKFIRNRGDV